MSCDIGPLAQVPKVPVSSESQRLVTYNNKPSDTLDRCITLAREPI